MLSLLSYVRVCSVLLDQLGQNPVRIVHASAPKDWQVLFKGQACPLRENDLILLLPDSNYTIRVESLTQEQLASRALHNQEVIAASSFTADHTSNLSSSPPSSLLSSSSSSSFSSSSSSPSRKRESPEPSSDSSPSVPSPPAVSSSAALIDAESAHASHVGTEEHEDPDPIEIESSRCSAAKKMKANAALSPAARSSSPFASSSSSSSSSSSASYSASVSARSSFSLRSPDEVSSSFLLPTFAFPCMGHVENMFDTQQAATIMINALG